MSVTLLISFLGWNKGVTPMMTQALRETLALSLVYRSMKSPDSASKKVTYRLTFSTV